MTRQTDQGAKRATDAQELAEGATYLSIQNELHVSSKTISKIKKQM